MALRQDAPHGRRSLELLDATAAAAGALHTQDSERAEPAADSHPERLPTRVRLRRCFALMADGGRDGHGRGTAIAPSCHHLSGVDGRREPWEASSLRGAWTIAASRATPLDLTGRWESMRDFAAPRRREWCGTMESDRPTPRGDPPPARAAKPTGAGIRVVPWAAGPWAVLVGDEAQPRSVGRREVAVTLALDLLRAHGGSLKLDAETEPTVEDSSWMRAHPAGASPPRPPTQHVTPPNP